MRNKKSGKKRKRIPSIQVTSIPNQLRKAREYPIKECYITEAWKEQGMANISILRQKPNYNLVVGIYLIDIWCLGLKDTFYNIDVSYPEIMDQIKNHTTEKHVLIDSDLAHSVIYGGIDYAKNLGFMPHRDFKYSKYILEPREEIEFDDSIEFGKNGKPHFFAGPYEAQDRINKIIAILTERVGEGNFQFTVPIEKGGD